jgi:hypothetical protein
MEENIEEITGGFAPNPTLWPISQIELKTDYSEN